MDKDSFSTPADILAESGHVGYSWDLTNDRIVWYGSWKDILDVDGFTPPLNASEFSKLVLSNDHHLIFNDPKASFDRTYRLHAEGDRLVTVHEHGSTRFEKGSAIRQQGILRKGENNDRQALHPFSSPDRDSLTGRPNRNCLQSLIEKITNGPPDIRKSSAYIVVSVDKLVFMNEAMGPKTADSFLCAVADRLNELCPTRCVIGRVGSDLFGILLPGMAAEVESVAARILDNFFNRAVTSDLYSLHVAISMGSVIFDPRRADGQTYMILAEQALSEARETGGNKHVVYVESPDRSKQNRIILETGERVKKALKTDAIRLAFQPVVDAHTGDVVFYEVLSRLFKEDGEAIPACDFIPVVERLGLAPDFDRYVLDKSIQELAASDTLRLAVNISGLTAALPDWPGYVQSKLLGHPQIARRLIIELTENAAVLDIAKIKCLVDSLKEMGSEVALDDFGAGATSIRHLRDLSLAIMKIDRDLLTNILESHEQQHLVRMLTSMAHGLGLRAVAEGIETEEVAVWLRNEKVDMLQGYHLGRPSFDKPWQKS